MEWRGDELLEHILAGGNESAVNELFNEFGAGYPIERLSLLLSGQNQKAADAGAWIASELGVRAAPLVNELSLMLNHPSRTVRFWLLDSMLVAATSEHGEALARAVLLVRDPDEAVRWKVLDLLTHATREQLASALPHLSGDAVASHLNQLLNTGTSDRDREEVITRLSEADPLTQLFAAAAAGRLGPNHISPLERAANSRDPAISKFAEDELAMHKLRETQRVRRQNSRRAMQGIDQAEGDVEK